VAGKKTVAGQTKRLWQGKRRGCDRETIRGQRKTEHQRHSEGKAVAGKNTLAEVKKRLC